MATSNLIQYLSQEQYLATDSGNSNPQPIQPDSSNRDNFEIVINGSSGPISTGILLSWMVPLGATDAGGMLTNVTPTDPGITPGVLNTVVAGIAGTPVSASDADTDPLRTRPGGRMYMITRGLTSCACINPPLAGDELDRKSTRLNSSHRT